MIFKRKRKTKFDNYLIEINACQEAREWARGKSIEEVINTCHRGDWMLWLYAKLEIDLKKISLAKGKCAETVIHLMKDERSKKAVEVAISYGEGRATEKEIEDAADAAYAAADAAYAAAYAADTTYAAVAAAYAAAYAAVAAAYAAAYAADTTYAAADAAAAYAAAASRKKTADICRELFGSELIELIKNK